MKVRHAIILSVAVTVGTTAFSEELGIAPTASATIIANDGRPLGVAEFVESPHGLKITVNAEGLQPGKHGMHIHSVGKCSPLETFSDAGPHFNPEGHSHGLFNPEGHHAGDLPNLSVGRDGTATTEVFAKNLTLSLGSSAILDADGAALVIHDGPDDHFTKPGGGSGPRVACGIISNNPASPKNG